VWKRGPDADAVDLTVTTVRGMRLTGIEALKVFLAGYHEQDRTTWLEL
jgi:hypothetical protein